MTVEPVSTQTEENEFVATIAFTVYDFLDRKNTSDIVMKDEHMSLSDVHNYIADNFLPNVEGIALFRVTPVDELALSRGINNIHTNDEDFMQYEEVFSFSSICNHDVIEVRYNQVQYE